MVKPALACRDEYSLGRLTNQEYILLKHSAEIMGAGVVNMK